MAPISSDPAAAAFVEWSTALVEDVAATAQQRRGAASHAAGFDPKVFSESDLLRVDFADGSVLYTHPGDFAARYGQLVSADLPEAGGTRTAAVDGARAAVYRIELPLALAPAPVATRGEPPAAQVSRYTLARLTPPTLLDKAFGLGAVAADAVDALAGGGRKDSLASLARQLCTRYEGAVRDARLKEQDGLLHWQGSPGAWSGSVDRARLQDSRRDVVLFLHGTASSTQGSFGELWAPAAKDGALPSDFAALAQRCELLAWEHRTLTRSPAHNAAELVAALQSLDLGARTVHLVSHSRGGLVGELLSLAVAGALGPGWVPEGIAFPAEDADALARLAAASGTLDWTLGRYVRVACPARGTLLADRRTDLFLSLLLRSVGLAFGTNGVPAWEMLNALVRSLVAARADARLLPGLEAMIPGSALTLALNMPDAPLPRAQALRVIAGDTSGRGWGGVLSLLGDVFFGLHDHDFVVHTHSMFGGPRRDRAMSLRIEDSSVTHFGYFKPQTRSRQALFEALAEADDEFGMLEADEARTRGLMQQLKPDPLCRKPWAWWLAQIAEAPPRKPLLFVLPGIMGSELSLAPAGSEAGQAAQLVWLALGAVWSGRLTRLELEPPGQAPALQPSGLMPSAYERLLDAARREFVVLPVPYDWRQPIAASGQAFGARFDEALAAAGERPVYVIAHSMGGLVARSAFFGEAQAGERRWRRLAAQGGRLLMLGTPNRGSYAPVQVLVRQHRMSSLLAMLATRVDSEDLANWAGRFAGLLEMLPSEPDAVFGSLYEPQTWQALSQVDRWGVRPPRREVLEAARQFRQTLDAGFEALLKNEHVLYVAGAGSTPLALDDPRGRWELPLGEGGSPVPAKLGFLYGPRGDGTVPWTSALHPDRTWYADCEHGSLADEPALFTAYFELLRTGRTGRLPQVPPARGRWTRGAEAGAAPLQARAGTAMASLPADPAAFVLGVVRRADGSQAAERIALKVIHGGLDYAHHPLLVGHYQNEKLTGAGARVDEKLGGQLQRMLELRLFVGAALTGAYLRPRPRRPDEAPAYPGAIVLGLGEIGELTPALLADSVARNVLRFVFEHLHNDAWSQSEGAVRLSLSAVLVGTHVQAVTPKDSLAALLQGLWHANQLLAADPRRFGRPVQVVDLEIIEIREDVALDAAYELRRLLQRREWAQRFVWHEPVLVAREGGLRGYRPGRYNAVWQRLLVRQDPMGGLKFELVGERARVESTSVYADVQSMLSYITRLADESASGRIDDEELGSLGSVLFQLLLPQDLKSRLANFENTVLVVDDESAAFPWELMTPPDEGDPGNANRPLAVQAGFIRQRLSSDFRSLPRMTGGWDVLLVGAPCTRGWRDEKGDAIDFPLLRGAQAEVQTVERLLRQAEGWAPHVLCGADVTFERVITSLVKRPYRMLHLAGHGVVDQWVLNRGQPPQVQAVRSTGMVLSHQRILSAADVQQMQHVPEFVFINCCYSGRDGTEAARAGQRYFPRVAASLAMQFIAMGAKAVVAAGWQVEDAAGERFAAELYRQLLDGENFGEAVRRAREEIHPAPGARYHSTWGAYQCYGDPDWRLRRDPDIATEGLLGPVALLKEVERCMSPIELAERVRQVVGLAGDARPAAVAQRLQACVEALLEDELRKHWLDKSEVQTALATAFRELGEYARAAQWFARAAGAAGSRLQLEHVEQAATSLSRAGGPGAQAVPGLVDRLGRLQEKLAQVAEADGPWRYGAIPAPGLTQAERLCLKGSHAMRASQGSSRKWLAAAAQSFLEAYRVMAAMQGGCSADWRVYALSSGMLCAALAVRRQADPHSLEMPEPRELEALVEALTHEARSRASFASYWDYTNLMDLLLSHQLWRVMAQDQAPELDRLAEADQLLEVALMRWPSPSELESLRWRIDQTARALEEGDFRQQVRAMLARIKAHENSAP